MSHPIPAFFNVLLGSYIYTDNVQLCRTPFDTLKKPEDVASHLIQNIWVLYQKKIIHTSKIGTPISLYFSHIYTLNIA